MSKTVATCIAETNQEQNKPQENVFFLTLSRKIEDFPNEFLRTARSTSPVQICAIFSTIGPDNLSAELNLELNAELEKIVASTANQPVLDFEAFSNLVVNTLNVKVMNFGLNKGKQFKTSMTMLVIEGDILRVIHLGITKAVLFRDNKIMVLTEEQTVAHRFAQMGSISPDEEKNHPENMNLTQYLGKMPQEGELKPEKKVHLKLKDDDEIILMGLGISRGMPAQMRNSIIVRPASTENKAKDIINAAVNHGVKSGLTIIDLKVESTFLLPGDAVIRTNLQSDSSIATVPAAAAVAEAKSDFTSFEVAEKEEDADDTISFNPGNMPVHENEPEEEVEEEAEDEGEEQEQSKAGAGKKVVTVVMPIIVFILCLILGFGVMFLVLNIKDFIEANAPETMPSAAVGTAYYAIADNTPVYSLPSQSSTVIVMLKRGDVVTLQQAVDQYYSKVVTSNSKIGYCLTEQLSTEDPTHGAATSETTSEGDPDVTETENAAGEPTTTEETTTEEEEEDPTPTPTPKPKKATATPTPVPEETVPPETEPKIDTPTPAPKPVETDPPETKAKPTDPPEVKPDDTKAPAPDPE